MSRPIARAGLTMADLQRLNRIMRPRPFWPVSGREWLLLALLLAIAATMLLGTFWSAFTVLDGVAAYLRAALLLWSCGGGPCG